MEEEKKKHKYGKYIILGLVFIMILFMLPTFDSEINNTFDCYDIKCNYTTLQQFDNCIDLGVESTGFLSSEHYYLCDNIKVTNGCISYEKVKRNETFIGLMTGGFFRCENKYALGEKD